MGCNLEETNLSKNDVKVLPNIQYTKKSFGIGGGDLIIEQSGKLIFRYITDGAPPVPDSQLTEAEKSNVLNMLNKIPINVFKQNKIPPVLDPTLGLVIQIIITSLETSKACSFYSNSPPDKSLEAFVEILEKIISRMGVT